MRSGAVILGVAVSRSAGPAGGPIIAGNTAAKIIASRSDLVRQFSSFVRLEQEITRVKSTVRRLRLAGRFISAYGRLKGNYR